MLNENEVLELLRKSLYQYIKRINENDLYYNINEGEIFSYLKVLNRSDLNITFLDIHIARDLLFKISRIKEI